MLAYEIRIWEPLSRMPDLWKQYFALDHLSHNSTFRNANNFVFTSNSPNLIYKQCMRTNGTHKMLKCMLHSLLRMYPTTVWIIQILMKWSVQACKQMHPHLSSLSDLWSCPEHWLGGGHCHPKSIFSFEVLTPLHILDMSLKKDRGLAITDTSLGLGGSLHHQNPPHPLPRKPIKRKGKIGQEKKKCSPLKRTLSEARVPPQ